MGQPDEAKSKDQERIREIGNEYFKPPGFKQKLIPLPWQRYKGTEKALVHSLFSVFLLHF